MIFEEKLQRKKKSFRKKSLKRRYVIIYVEFRERTTKIYQKHLFDKIKIFVINSLMAIWIELEKKNIISKNLFIRLQD